MSEVAKIGIIMGSQSDLPIMQQAAEHCQAFGVPYELTIVSAHRTPQRMMDYARTSHTRGLQVIIAGAGGAAHLPGMVASMTPLPVIGVPIHSSNSIDGWDSILSILQMPNGIPVATVALDAAANAAILAVRMLAASDTALQKKVFAFNEQMTDKVMASVGTVSNDFPCQF